MMLRCLFPMEIAIKSHWKNGHAKFEVQFLSVAISATDLLEVLPYNNVSLRGYTSKFYGSKYGTWCLQSIAELAMDVATLPLRPVVTCNLSPRPVPVLSLYPVQIMYILYFLYYILYHCVIYIYMHICILSYFSLCEILYIYICIHTHMHIHVWLHLSKIGHDLQKRG